MRVQTAKKQRYKILLLFSLPTNRIVEIPLYGFLVQLKYVVISIRSKVRISKMLSIAFLLLRSINYLCNKSVFIVKLKPF